MPALKEVRDHASTLGAQGSTVLAFVDRSQRAWKAYFDAEVELRWPPNAERCGTRVELRVVLHEQSAPTLVDLGNFIARNLPFVDQVALMGLEHIGFVKPNASVLKAHPAQYAEVISNFASTLRAAGIRTHVFNLPLCFLPPSVWPIARQSISDWKNEMPDKCAGCAVQQDCGGFFAWNVGEFEHSLRPFTLEEGREFRRLVGR